MALSFLQRQRRVARLCCHCLRNLAYYRAWYEEGKPHENRNFWVNANGNFVEIALLEWCKVFGEWNGAYHFRKVVGDPDAVRVALLAAVGKTQQEWEDYIAAMKKYRDKFVAHWDEDVDGPILPQMDFAKDSMIFLLDHCVENEGEVFSQWDDVPHPAGAFYRKMLTDGRAACAAIYG
jgi:hypothetical protein